MLAVALGLPGVVFALESAAPPKSEPDIIRAVRTGDSSQLRAILSRGVGLSARDSHGDTALHIAAYRGDAAAVEALLERGAKPDTPDDNGATALLYGAGPFQHHFQGGALEGRPERGAGGCAWPGRR